MIKVAVPDGRTIENGVPEYEILLAGIHIF
jgi:hypothetical protein